MDGFRMVKKEEWRPWREYTIQDPGERNTTSAFDESDRAASSDTETVNWPINREKEIGVKDKKDMWFSKI